jgi:type VI secretion system protein ImpA
MPSPQTLDIEALLAPIDAENPAGEDLRHEGTYDKIAQARREGDDRDALQPGVKTADWAAVIAVASDALSDKSKDLQIAIWLVEALVKLHGFAGLRDGLTLLRELQRRFWAALYPAVVDGDLEDRMRLLEWLDNKLPLSIRQVPLAQSVDGKLYSWLHWQESRAVDNLGRQNPAAKAEAVAEGKITGEEFDKAVMATPRRFYEELVEDLTQCQEEYEELDRALTEHFGRQGPSLRSIKNALDDYAARVEGIVEEKRKLEPEFVHEGRERSSDRGLFDRLRRREEDPAVSQPGQSSAGVVSFAGGVPLEPIDRADALRRLAAVADFFRRTEPHSPVAPLVERAIRWGEMPLEKWLEDVIGGDPVLDRVRETLGLKNSDTGSDN